MTIVQAPQPLLNLPRDTTINTTAKMPKKPRRCTIKLEPMETRSLTRAHKSLNDLLNSSTATPLPDDHKMPALASLIAAALNTNCLEPAPAPKNNASITAPPVKIAPAPTVSPVKELELRASSPTASTIMPTMSPSKEDRPKRRRREPIKLPPGVALAKLSAKDLRRLKNRIAANRLRQRSQEDIRTLQEQMKYYRARCEFLEIVISGCASCSSLSAMQFSDIELIPVETEIKKEKTSDEKIHDEDDSTVLTEVECIVLDKVLQN